MKTTGEDIFKALENADEHYIEECRQSGSGIKIKTIWTKWAAVAACGVIAAATGVMMFAGRSDKDIKVGADIKVDAGQQASDDEFTDACKVPWDELSMGIKYEFIKYNGVDYSSRGFVPIESCLDQKLETQVLKTVNTDTEKQETTKADIYTIKNMSQDVFLAAKFNDGSIAWYQASDYDPMEFDTMVKDMGFDKNAKIKKVYNYIGQGKLRVYNDVDMGKLLDLLKDDNGSYNAVYEGDAYESDPDINLSVTNDDEYYIEGGITISFYVERLDVNGTAYFTANGDLYVQLFAGDILKFDIGGEKAEKLENWLNENCEYTDVKKNAEVAGDVDPSENAVTSVAKDDPDKADEVDIGYINYFEDVGDNTFTTKDGRLTAKYSYEVGGGEFISHITYTNNWDKDMALDFTTDQYITTEDSKGNSTSYGESGDRNTMNTLLKAGESYTYDNKTDIGADYVKGTAKITLIANTASDKNCNGVNYVTLKDIEIDFQ